MTYRKIIAILLLLALTLSLASCKNNDPDYVHKDNSGQNENENNDSDNNNNSNTKTVYVYSTSARKLHKESCPYATALDELFKMTYDGDPLELMEKDKGFLFCGLCCPEESALYNPKNENEDIFDNGITEEDASYVLNTGTGRFHELDCRFAEEISPENKLYTTLSKYELTDNGYHACKTCNP